MIKNLKADFLWTYCLIIFSIYSKQKKNVRLLQESYYPTSMQVNKIAYSVCRKNAFYQLRSEVLRNVHTGPEPSEDGGGVIEVKNWKWMYDLKGKFFVGFLIYRIAKFLFLVINKFYSFLCPTWLHLLLVICWTLNEMKNWETKFSLTREVFYMKVGFEVRLTFAFFKRYRKEWGKIWWENQKHS